MRILVDLQPLQTASKTRGIGRYVISTAKALLRNAGKHEIYCLVNSFELDTVIRIRQMFKDVLPRENIIPFYASGPVNRNDINNTPRGQIAQLMYEYAVNLVNPDVLLVLSAFEGYIGAAVTAFDKSIGGNYSIATIIHDLIPLYDHETYFKDKTYQSFYVNRIQSLHNTDAVIADSKSSANEAQQFIAVDEGRISVAYPGKDEIFNFQGKETSTRIDISKKIPICKPFFMHVGVVEPRKNFRALIKAYSLIPYTIRKEYQLVLVVQGNNKEVADLYQYVFKCNLSDKEVLITGYVENDELLQLYRMCHLFVFPSLHEGFGLPALEAMACGTPTIGSDRTSIPEVLGHDKALFDPTRPEKIADKIIEVVTDEELYDELCAHVVEYSKRFTWDKTALRILSVLETVVDEKKTTSRSVVDTSVYRNLISKLRDNLSQQIDSCEIARLVVVNESISISPTIFIDVSELRLRDAGTGIQRVTKQIVRHFLQMDFSPYTIELVFGSLDDMQYHYAANYKQTYLQYDIDTSIEGEIIIPKPHDIFLGLDLTAHFYPAFSKVLNCFKERGVTIAFIVHDLIAIMHPHYCDAQMPIAIKSWLNSIMQYADCMITVSKSVGMDLQNYIRENSARYGNIQVNHSYHGANIIDENKDESISEFENNILADIKSTTSFLMVGTLEPRKGHEQVIDAFEVLWRQGCPYKLVIAGKPGWKVEQLQEKINTIQNNTDKLLWLDEVSDFFLKELYKSSTALIAASYAEGFGLPIIEAAKYGIPIIARDLPVFREIAGVNIYYFDFDTDGRGMAQSIRAWVELYKEEMHPKSEKIHLLNWLQSAKNLKDILLRTKRKQLFIDVSELAERDAESGIQRVVKNILFNLTQLHHEYVIKPVCMKEDGNFYAIQWSIQNSFICLDSEHIARQTIYSPNDIFLGGLDLSLQFFPRGDEAFKLMKARGVEIHFVIHDIVALLYPQFCDNELSQAFSRWFDSVINISDYIHCVSGSVRNDIKQYIDNNNHQYNGEIDFFHHGANFIDNEPLLVQNSTIEKESIVFLMVGTLEPRKAHEYVLDAFEILWEKGFDCSLVIIGKEGWKTKNLLERIKQHERSEKYLFWYDRVDDIELAEMYKSSSSLIAASYAEGFGLPLIEAARYNLPIIARDIPVFREVAKENAFYFDNNTDPHVLAEAVMEWIEKYRKNEHPESKGMHYLTWEKSAKMLLNNIQKTSCET